MKFTKHIFWEVPVFDGNSTVLDVDVIIQSIPSTVLKSYWMEPRWFQGDDELEKKYQLLVALCGPEKQGAARAQCTDGDDAYRIIRQNEAYLRENGIEIW